MISNNLSEHQTIAINHELSIAAPIETVFKAILEEIGPSNQARAGEPMPMIVEARPGGRWYRDLGDDNGHCWGLVQAIKKPTLLEISGPLFMSYPIINNIQWRLNATDTGCTLIFHHLGSGLIAPDDAAGVQEGWQRILKRIEKRATHS